MRRIPHALCRLLALLACVMCGQLAPGAQAAEPVSSARVERSVEAATALRSHTSPRPSTEEAAQGPTGSHEEREESDDDPDQDDDFDDDAETLGHARRPRSVPPATAWFHHGVRHDPISLGHYYFDPRPPRRC